MIDYSHLIPERAPRGKLAAEFVEPPFSVLNARGGDWQRRKAAWVALGIEGEVKAVSLAAPVGRDEGLIGNWANLSQWVRDQPNVTGCAQNSTGTSIFDPVLTELVYEWFCPPGGQVIDPFAGGAVRGVVASVLGRRYWGSELRAVQVEANRAQATTIVPGAEPTWVCGDSRETIASAPDADMILTCPPYGDLERYSDDPRDISTMDYDAFIAAYREILSGAVARLRDDRFAVVVVGDFRGKDGNLRGLPAVTVSIMQDIGCPLYNDGVLVTSVGSLALRAGKQMRSSRKLGRGHQFVLCFVKGSWRRAAAACRGTERTE